MGREPTDPTALDTAAPMMMAAAVEPVALAATAPTTFAVEESSTVDATSDPTADLDTAAPMMMAAAVEPVARGHRAGTGVPPRAPS